MGASRNGGAVAPAAGGFNGRSRSAGDGAISGGASLPGAALDKGAVAPAGGGMRTPSGGGDVRCEAGGGEAAPGVCAELAVATAIIATRPKAGARQRPSETGGFAAAGRLKPTCIVLPTTSTWVDFRRTVFDALTALPQIQTTIT
jgi:hypothetical protein